MANAVDAKIKVRYQVPKLPLKYKSKYFHFYTPMSKNSLVTMAEKLEIFYSAVHKDLPFETKHKIQPVAVYIFKDKKDYQKYCRKQIPKREGSAAFCGLPKYDTSKKRYQRKYINVTYLPRTYLSENPFRRALKMLQETLFHEATHAIILSHMRPPGWLSEGLACYYSTARIKGKKVIFGEIPKWRLRYYLKKIRQRSCSSFQKLFKAKNGELSRLQYCQAWALVHFFLQGKTPLRRRLFRQYLRKCQKQELYEYFYEEVFRSKPEELEPFIRHYVLKLAWKKARAKVSAAK